MKQRVFVRRVVQLLCVTALSSFNNLPALAQTTKSPFPQDPYDANDRKPDERYKADVLVVVAHPDDEVMAAAYIARRIEEGKRVAIVWTTIGDGGTNVAGPEQAAAMGDIREVEAMRAAGSLGIFNMWNLGAPDTPSQSPLESLETCNHGRCLDRLVRIVRLTRPAVILTWLPLGVTGENHGDHQASGVMATEAFDLAGDPTAFPEQVAPAREPDRNMNHTEGLRTWQPEKIYYFSNPTHTDFFVGQGPEYPSTDISPTRHVTYGEIAAKEFSYHLTQGGGRVVEPLLQHDLKALEQPIPLMKSSQFILGKSLVKCGVTDDVFAGVIPDGIPYHSHPGYIAPVYTNPVVEIGGTSGFYREFWQAHGLDHLGKLIPNEVTIPVSGNLNFPLTIENPTDKSIAVTFHVQAPGEWTVSPLQPASIGPHTRYYVRLRAAAPSTKLSGWQTFKVSAEADGKSLGNVSLQVELASWALPE